MLREAQLRLEFSSPKIFKFRPSCEDRSAATMLRRCARSIGSNRRLWETSIVKKFTSACSGSDSVPSRDFHSPGGHRALSGLRPSSLLSNKCICEDFGTERAVAASKLSFPFVDQGLKSSPSSSGMLDNHNLSQRRSLSYEKSTELQTHPFRWTGDSFPSIRSLRSPTGQVRLSTSKSGDASESVNANSIDASVDSDDGETHKVGATKSPPRSIEDFQHEEIVGPTVERDLSDTADQVRESLEILKGYMASFGTGFVVLGTVQLVAAIWSFWVETNPSSIGLWRDLPLVFMSYTFAYLLRNNISANDFFAKLEGRSRIRVLTLSLQVIKGLSHFFQRSGFTVKAVAFTSLLTLIIEAFPLN